MRGRAAVPRKATWLVIAWTAFMAVVATVVSSGGGGGCGQEEGSGRGACEMGASIVAGLSLFVVVVIWFVGLAFTCLVWLKTRRPTTPPPEWVPPPTDPHDPPTG